MGGHEIYNLLGENQAFNKSSPFISLFGHSGCVCPWLKPEVLSFPFGAWLPYRRFISNLVKIDAVVVKGRRTPTHSNMSPE